MFAGALKKDYVEATDIINDFSMHVLKNCKLSFYSSGTCTKVVENCNQGNIELHGWINRSELELEYMNADALVSIAEKKINRFLVRSLTICRLANQLYISTIVMMMLMFNG